MFSPGNRFNMNMIINTSDSTLPLDSEVNEQNKLKNKEIIQNYFKNTTYKYHIAFYNTFPEAKNAELELLMRFENICNKYNIGYFIIYNNNNTHDFIFLVFYEHTLMILVSSEFYQLLI
jgi:hypothetical protein